MNVSITKLSDLGERDTITVYCGNPRCSRHSMGEELDIPATIKEYGDLALMCLGARFRCQDCGYKPGEVRIGHRLPASQAQGWVSGFKA